MEDVSPVYLKDVYDEDVANIFVTVISVIGCIGVASSSTVLLIIFFKSTRSMKKFKLCLLCYVFCNLVIELIILLYKPVFIPPSPIVYPRGFLSPMNDVASRIFIAIIILGMFGILLIFMIMLVQRYSAISIHESLSIKNFYQHPTFYTFLTWAIFVSSTILLLLSLFLFNIFHSGKETFTAVQKYIIDGDRLLKYQPNLLQLNQEVMKHVGPIFIVFYFIYTVSFIVLFILCFKSFKHYSPKVSFKTWKNNKMLFKSICFQLLTMLSMIVIPVFILLTIVYFHISSKYIYYFIISIVWIFPTIDNIVIIVTITPYRKFFTNKIKWLRTPLSSQGKINQVAIVKLCEHDFSNNIVHPNPNL